MNSIITNFSSCIVIDLLFDLVAFQFCRFVLQVHYHASVVCPDWHSVSAALCNNVDHVTVCARRTPPVSSTGMQHIIRL